MGLCMTRIVFDRFAHTIADEHASACHVVRCWGSHADVWAADTVTFGVCPALDLNVVCKCYAMQTGEAFRRGWVARSRSSGVHAEMPKFGLCAWPGAAVPGPQVWESTLPC